MHVLHDEEELAVGGDDVERRHDVRVPDARGEARLVEEHRDELGILGELRVEALDRDRAREADRTEQPPEVDRRHAAGGDLVVERIAPDDAQRSAFSRHHPGGSISLLRLVPQPDAAEEPGDVVGDPNVRRQIQP